MSTRVTTVVEIYRKAGEIQYTFTPKWNYWKDFFVPCKTTWCSAIKNKTLSDSEVNFWGQI